MFFGQLPPAQHDLRNDFVATVVYLLMQYRLEKPVMQLPDLTFVRVRNMIALFWGSWYQYEVVTVMDIMEGWLNVVERKRVGDRVVLRTSKKSSSEPSDTPVKKWVTSCIHLEPLEGVFPYCGSYFEVTLNTDWSLQTPPLFAVWLSILETRTMQVRRFLFPNLDPTTMLEGSPPKLASLYTHRNSCVNFGMYYPFHQEVQQGNANFRTNPKSLHRRKGRHVNELLWSLGPLDAGSQINVSGNRFFWMLILSGSIWRKILNLRFAGVLG